MEISETMRARLKVIVNEAPYDAVRDATLVGLYTRALVTREPTPSRRLSERWEITEAGRRALGGRYVA